MLLSDWGTLTMMRSGVNTYPSTPFKSVPDARGGERAKKCTTFLPMLHPIAAGVHLPASPCGTTNTPLLYTLKEAGLN